MASSGGYYDVVLRDFDKRMSALEKKASNLEPKLPDDGSIQSRRGKINSFATIDGERLPTGSSRNYKGLLICEC